MTPPERESLRGEILRLGFDEVHFAASDAPAGVGFSEWIDAGHHADMTWLERGAARRADSQQVLPGARTIVVLGVVALPKGEAAAQTRWAKYSLFEDYHLAIGRALGSAVGILAQRTGQSRECHRAYVDTGPILERGWAAAAGLGWQGKNAMLISRRHGNWLLLSVILTTAVIPPDPPLGARAPGAAPPVGRHCGSCTRCLDACPTDAFPRPGWVDSRRCIAYHTIENRGIVPRELRSAFGGRIFGCDTCLDVCPWNRFATASRETMLTARADIAGMSLVDILRLDEPAFRGVFRKSPVKRTKLPGLLRNACIAAGNWHECADWHFGAGRDPGTVADAVEVLCSHESPVVRAHAVWALHRLRGKQAAGERLATLLCAERDPDVLAELDSAVASNVSNEACSSAARRDDE